MLLAVSSVGLTACSSDDSPSSTPTATTTTPQSGTVRDIVDTAVAAGSFKTLAAALTAADLVKTLKGTG